nr:MFS transporter [Staphylococcus carnosus]
MESVHQLNQLSRTIKARMLCDFLLTLSSSAILPFIALYLTTMINAVFAGIFLMATVIIGFIVSFIGGYVSDHFERKKVISFVHGIYTVCLVILIISVNMHGIGLILFCITFFIFSITNSFEMPILEAAIMDAIQVQHRDFIYRFFYWMNNIAMAIGMLIGAALYAEHRHLLFGLFLAANLISWYVFVFIYDVQQKFANHDSLDSVVKKFLHGYVQAFKNKPYIILMLAFSFVFMAEASLDTYVVVRLQKTFDPISFLGIRIDGVRIFTLIMIVNTVTVAFLTFYVNRLMESYSKKAIFVIGIFCYTFGYIIITSANVLFFILVFAFIATIGEIIYSPIYNSERFALTPEHARGVYSSIGSLGFTTAKILAQLGLVISTFLTPWMMSIYTGVIVLIGFVLMYLVLFKMPKVQQVKE